MRRSRRPRDGTNLLQVATMVDCGHPIIAVSSNGCRPRAARRSLHIIICLRGLSEVRKRCLLLEKELNTPNRAFPIANSIRACTRKSTHRSVLTYKSIALNSRLSATFASSSLRLVAKDGLSLKKRIMYVFRMKTVKDRTKHDLTSDPIVR